MKTLIASILFMFGITAFAGVPYLVSPTNSPGLVGQQIFSTGIPNTFYWDYGTNAASTNSSVLVASPSIGVTTNSPTSYTPFFSAAMTNWINALLVSATNNALIVATNNDNQVRIDETNNVTKVIGQLVLTNVVVIQGANMTVVTNVSGGVTSYTVSTSASGATTNVFVAAGANVTVTTNVVGSSTIYTVAASSGSGVAVAAGPDILMSTNAGIVTISFNTNATGIATLTGTNNAVLQFGGTPPGIMMTLSNALISAGSEFAIDTNANPETITTISTNGYPAVVNALAFGLATNGDMSSVIQAAITQATNLWGFKVHIPAGTYSVSNLVIPSNVVLEGDGSERPKLASTRAPGAASGTILYFGANTGTMIRLQGGGQLIQNIALYSGGAGTALIADTNAPTTVSQYFTMQHCRIEGFNIGVSGYSLENAMFFDNYLGNNITNYYFTNAANANRIIGGHIGPGTYGVRLEAGTGAVCDGNIIDTTIESCSNGVSVVGTSANTVTMGPGSHCESNTNDLVVNGANGVKVVAGHYDITVGGTNFVFVGVKGFDLNPNFVYDGSRAMNIESTSTGGKISIETVGINPTSFGTLCKASSWFGWEGTNVVLTGPGGYYGNGVGLSNVVSTVVTNGGYSANQVARSNIVDQIQVFPSSTNSLVAVPGSTSWILQSSTPTAQTNVSGTLTALQWVFQSLIVSNSTAAAFTNWITIPGAVAWGYAATNDAASLGFNGCVVPASKAVEVMYKMRLGATNYAIINP